MTTPYNVAMTAFRSPGLTPSTQRPAVPVYRTLLSDSLTPVSAFQKLGGGEWSFLLESVVGGERVGRYSFLGADPFATFIARDKQIRLESTAGVEEFTSPNPMEELSRRIKAYKALHIPGLPRFIGGAVGFAAYDSVRYYEPLPNPPTDDRHLPDLCFGFYDQMVVFDHVAKTATVVVLTDAGDDFAAQKRIDAIVEKLSAAETAQSLPAIDPTADAALPWKSNFTKEGFEEAVEKSKEYIAAGDFFQIALSQRLEVESKATPFDVYRMLRVVNPSPFMVYFAGPGATLVASSPEIMVRVENGKITTRPLAGTRPRGKEDEEDKRLAAELLADPKERAEHVMLVDLGRNDVGRVAELGSVKIDDLMVVERYSHVMHITSNVSGMLRPDLHAIDALAACLPAGTVSGAPKVRAMQVIDELEPHRRGPYAGAIGYVDFTGNMDTCIGLRTMVAQNGRFYIQAGAGIVYDSVPESEYFETLNKARGLLKAVALAERFLS
jgi:anthranilate synthase component I